MLDSFESISALIITLSAIFAALAGLVVLEAFFRNKLKLLFDDVNYFIYFSMVSGYFLYALGEISFYLSRQVFKDASPIGIHDIYWTSGAVLILVSFIGLAFTLFKEHGGTAKFGAMLIIGAALLAIVLTIVLGTKGKQASFFSIFYPIISSLIITVALSTVLFSRQLGQIAKPLLIFFLASCGILLGDILFYFSVSISGYSSLSLLTNLSYFWGYTLSLAAFVSLKLHLNRSALELEAKKASRR